MSTVAVPRPRAGSAGATFVVASSCPRCGAALDFAEGSNAVRCGHCASVLLVTGRRRVLRWVVRPRVTALEARKLASFAGGGSRAQGTPRLVFVPYYRLSAEELFWRRERVRRVEQARDLERSSDESARLLRALGGGTGRFEGEYELDLASRTIERSFLACGELAALASWSLGVRSGVLRLELFERAALERVGTVVEPTLAPDAALARALQPQHGGDTIARDVLRVVLSLIWFPLWVVPGESGRITVADGVGGSLIAREMSGAALDAAIARREEARGVVHVVGLRALACPNCGWDLPLRAADVVFHCASCERSWELRGEDLDEIASDVIAPTAADASGVLPRLPVWEVRGVARTTAAQASEATEVSRAALPQRLFAPAFPWRRMDHLCDLGVRLARGTPGSPELESVKDMALAGCALDREDALVLARMVALALLLDDGNARFAAARGRALPEIAIDGATTRLVWLPFAGDAYSVRDPFTGYALPRRAVEELLR